MEEEDYRNEENNEEKMVDESNSRIGLNGRIKQQRKERGAVECSSSGEREEGLEVEDAVAEGNDN